MISTKDDTLLSQACSLTYRTARRVVLLDGRIVEAELGVNLPLIDRDGISTPIRFGLFDKKNPFHQSVFSCLATTLSTHSLRYNSTVCHATEKWLRLPTMVGKDLIGIPEINALSEIQASYRPFIIPLLRRIKDSNTSVLSDEACDFLENSHSWEEKSQGAYYGLITNDPEKGALTEEELHNANSVLNNAFALGLISQDTYTLCWFFIGTGVRPVQARRMRKRDVVVHDRQGFDVTLRIPLAKGEKTVADEYWLRRAPTVLAETLISYLDTPAMRDAKDHDHLFLGQSSRELSRKVVETFSALDTYSDRLGAKIPITPYRFRYTLATRALAQGASDYEVARLLTHRSTSCIQYYRASMPELQKPIREALGKEMGYFARAFQGKPISGLHEATRAGDPDAVITDFMRLMGMPVGACGTRAECHQNAPVACLAGCAHFEPLLSAPWETLMAFLVADQEIETELRIRQINHSAMSAIQQIITIRDTSEEAF